jgi:hypothetical protein
MNMTSRFTLVAATGLIWAGCSSPAEDAPDAPTTPPPLATNPGAFGQGGTTSAPVTPAPTPVAQGGTTGQTGVVPAGTGGTAAAVAGAGGAPAAAGGAPAGNGDIPIGTGLAITPGVDGWVAGSSNGLGIQGAFFAASDATGDSGTPTGTGTTITFDSMTTPGTVCVSGNLPAIPPDPTGTEGAFLYTTHWGGLVGLNLRQVIPAGGMALPASGWPQQSPAGRVTGFTYTVTPNGGAVLPHLRFTVDFVGRAGDSYCQDPAGPSASFATVKQACWAAGGVAAVPPTSDLLTVQWSIIPSETAATPFNFCVSNVRATVSP